MNARGRRANVLIIDEYRIVPKDIVDTVLRKFRSSTRYCGYLNNPKYAHIKERNKEIYLSSTYYKYSWAYKHFLAFLLAMKQGKGYFVCALPYQLAVMEGIKNLEELTEEYNEETTDELMWKMEYESYWIGNDDDMSFFKYDKIDPCRKVVKAFYPRSVIDDMPKEEKYFNYMKKTQNEIRILTCDFARKEGSANDNTSIGLIILKQVDDEKMNTSYFQREIPFLTTMNGVNTLVQALDIRRYYEWFECDYIVLDMQNIGAGVFDALALPMRDPVSEKEYEPLGCINHDEMKLGEVMFPNAPKKIYGISASPQLNSDIGYLMRDLISKKRISFLTDEGYFRINVAQYIKSYDILSVDTRGKLVQPYIQVSALLNEMQGLEYTISPDTNILRLKEKSGARKDRYSSISYGNYFASILEKDLLKRPTKEFDLEDLVGYHEL